MRRTQKIRQFISLDGQPPKETDNRFPLIWHFGGGKGGSKAPDPPNYAAAAQAQGQADKETAVLNAAYGRPTQVTPQGTQNWSFKGKDINNPQPGDWVVTTSLSPEQQNLYNQNIGLSTNLNDIANQAVGRVGSQLGTPFDMSQVTAGAMSANMDARNQLSAGLQGVQSRSGALPSSVADFQSMADQAAKANYADVTKYYQDRFAKDQAAMDTQLRNQGLQPGTEAYKNAMLEFNRNKNDAYAAAVNQAVAAGNSVANQNFQNLLSSTTAAQGLDTNAQNAIIQAIQARQGITSADQQLRQQQIAEQAYLRSLPLNEANALRTGNQVSMPQFSGYQNANVQSAPIYQATNDLYGQQVANANAQNASSSNWMSGLMGLGGQLGSAWLLS